MAERTPYVMFGHSRVLGDLVQAIDLVDGVLTRVVQNVPESARPPHLDLEARLARFHDPEWNPTGVNAGRSVEVVQLEDFEPQQGERYVIGFTGAKMRPLVDEVTARYGVTLSGLIHPAAAVTPTARVGPGTIVLAHAMVESFTQVGAHVYLNKQVLVGHDTVVGDYCTIAPGARLAGHVTVEDGATVGMGAQILEDRTIGEGATVAAGAVVIDDVPPGAMVAGVPAVIKKAGPDAAR